MSRLGVRAVPAGVAELVLAEPHRERPEAELRAAERRLERELGVERLRALVPEAADLPIERHALPNLWSLNFVQGLLGDGVASSTRSDPQAKSLGEYLRARLIDVPRVLLAD